MMKSVEHLGTAQDVYDRVGAFGQALLDRLRAAVQALDPHAVEVPSPRERLIWWGTGPRKMRDGYVYMVVFNKHANLGFFQGDALPDPENLLGGPGKKLRHLKVTSADQIDAPAVRALLSAAIAERRQP